MTLQYTVLEDNVSYCSSNFLNATRHELVSSDRRFVDVQ
jgi:hypothetical protein